MNFLSCLPFSFRCTRSCTTSHSELSKSATLKNSLKFNNFQKNNPLKNSKSKSEFDLFYLLGMSGLDHGKSTLEDEENFSAFLKFHNVVQEHFKDLSITTVENIADIPIIQPKQTSDFVKPPESAGSTKKSIFYHYVFDNERNHVYFKIYLTQSTSPSWEIKIDTSTIADTKQKKLNPFCSIQYREYNSQTEINSTKYQNIEPDETGHFQCQRSDSCQGIVLHRLISILNLIKGSPEILTTENIQQALKPTLKSSAEALEMFKSLAIKTVEKNFQIKNMIIWDYFKNYSQDTKSSNEHLFTSPRHHDQPTTASLMLSTPAIKQLILEKNPSSNNSLNAANYFSFLSLSLKSVLDSTSISELIESTLTKKNDDNIEIYEIKLYALLYQIQSYTEIIVNSAEDDNTQKNKLQTTIISLFDRTQNYLNDVKKTQNRASYLLIKDMFNRLLNSKSMDKLFKEQTLPSEANADINPLHGKP